MIVAGDCHGVPHADIMPLSHVEHTQIFYDSSTIFLPFLGSDWAVGDNVAEMDLLSQQTINGQEMIMVCSASPTFFRWTPDSVGYQNMSGLEIENNNAGTPSVLALAMPNPTQSSVIGFQGGTVFANYQPVAQVHS